MVGNAGWVSVGTLRCSFGLVGVQGAPLPAPTKVANGQPGRWCWLPAKLLAPVQLSRPPYVVVDDPAPPPPHWPSWFTFTDVTGPLDAPLVGAGRERGERGQVYRGRQGRKRELNFRGRRERLENLFSFLFVRFGLIEVVPSLSILPLFLSSPLFPIFSVSSASLPLAACPSSFYASDRSPHLSAFDSSFLFVLFLVLVVVVTTFYLVARLTVSPLEERFARVGPWVLQV